MRLCVTVFGSVRVCVRACVLRQYVASVTVKRSVFPLHVEVGVLYSNRLYYCYPTSPCTIIFNSQGRLNSLSLSQLN